MALDTLLNLQLNATQQTALDLATAAVPLAYNANYQLASGTGANQAQKMFSDQRTLAASTSEDLDLAGTALTDALGVAFTITKLKMLIVKAAAGNTNDVVVGGASSNGVATLFADATDKIKVKPGGILVLVAPDANGYAVTAATGDLLTIANSSSGSSVTYDIIVIGV